MMDFPLTLTALLERAGKYFSGVELVSRRPDRSIARTRYADFYRRARQLAAALQGAGLRRGERVASLMWNHAGHLEAYFGVPAAGGVLHTLNLRLHAEELAYIATHAADRFLIVDDVLLPVLESFRARAGFERVFVVPFGGGGTGSPAPGTEDYEAFLQTGDGDGLAYPALDENEGATMCYTSGTTGQPKGVLYSHRAVVLHSFAQALSDGFGFQQQDVVLPLGSMFHANAWGYPFTAVMVGAKMVFPGPYLDAESLLELMDKERVTLASGVPTIWVGILDALNHEPQRWKLVPGLRTACAGSAVPETLFRGLDRHGIHVFQLWGMTETTPLATACHLAAWMEGLDEEKKYATRALQGRPMPFVEIRAVSGTGEVAWDGVTVGELEVRGPWVAARYYNFPEAQARWTADGWFRTGDMVTINADGYIKICDRAKDLIKTGGEWVSSVDLENALMGHPGVREAAVIGVPHPKWQERPLAVVVCREGHAPTPQEMREFLGRKFAKWQLPDAFVFVDAIPKTSVGKFLKTKIREQYAGWKWEP
jgi:fatty-acyl-CoA synthase